MHSGLSFLVAARQCEIAELRHLACTVELAHAAGALVHALQHERGTANLFLASGAQRWAAQRQDAMARTDTAEGRLRDALGRIDDRAGGAGYRARLFARIAYVLHGLDALPDLRRRIGAGRDVAPPAARRAYGLLIGGLLAVVFEGADSATDPDVSRLLVALFHFMQGKEFAGQERATGVELLSAGRANASLRDRLLQLIDSQERCLQVFDEFAPADTRALLHQGPASASLADLERLRRLACTAAAATADARLSGDWYDCCSRRIDAMQAVETHLADALRRRCAERIAQVEAELRSQQSLLDTVVRHGEGDATHLFFDESRDPHEAPHPAFPLVAGGLGPQLERSVLDMLREQTQRLQDISDELRATRIALDERKRIERAKGLLMRHRGLDEEAAYRMLRQTAMEQNRRLADVAETVLSMATLLAQEGAPPR